MDGEYAGYVEVCDWLGGYSVWELKEMISYAPEHPADL